MWVLAETWIYLMEEWVVSKAALMFGLTRTEAACWRRLLALVLKKRLSLDWWCRKYSHLLIYLVQRVEFIHQ